MLSSNQHDVLVRNPYDLLAIDLANFLNELHKIQLLNGPTSRREVPLKNLEREISQSISQLDKEFDREIITEL